MAVACLLPLRIAKYNLGSDLRVKLQDAPYTSVRAGAKTSELSAAAQHTTRSIVELVVL